MINDETERVLDAAETPDRGTEAPAEDEVAALRRELVQLQAEAEQYRNKYLRAAADMDNYRKFVERQRTEGERAFKRALIARFLPVMDNLERALAQSTNPGATMQALAEGVDLTRRGLLAALAAQNVQAIEARGATFDPHLHEAVGTAPATPEAPAGTILDVAETGYTLDGLVLRPARVVVASAE